MPARWGSAGAHANVQLPERFKCRLCQRLKPNTAFSAREKETYQMRKGKGDSVDAVTANLRCIMCAGGSTAPTQVSIQCHGPCGLEKTLVWFSKVQRQNPTDPRCKECVDYMERQLPGTEMEPPPGTELTQAERARMLGSARTLTLADIEGTSFDSDDSDAFSDDGDESSILRLTSDYGQPFRASASSISAPTTSFADGDDDDGWSTVGSTAKAGIPFNAWDGSGNKQTRYRVPTEWSATSTASTHTKQEDTTSVSSIASAHQDQTMQSSAVPTVGRGGSQQSRRGFRGTYRGTSRGGQRAGWGRGIQTEKPTGW